MTVQHPHAELSAYIDDALAPADRAAVEAHVDACPVCRTHVAQLRATTTLLRALPDPIPTRHLVPRLGVPAWMAPLRTLMTLASGAAVFLFIASSLLTNISFLAGGSATTASSRDAGAEAAAPAAPAAAQDTRFAAPTQAPGPSQQTAFAVAPTGSPSLEATRGLTPSATADAAKRLDASPAAPPAPGEVTTAEGRTAARTSQPQPSPLLSPWLWLGLAILSGAFAIALHRRLHKAA